MAPGTRVAVEVARRFAIWSDRPELLQETNNTVVWLRPHPVVAKVGVPGVPNAALVREFEVAGYLASHGAAVAAPWPGTHPVRHEPSGSTVTLWCRLHRDPTGVPDEREIAGALAALHAALAGCPVAVPSFRDGLARARATLDDDRAMAALPGQDLSFLRSVFAELMADLAGREFPEQLLHGEPHGDNLVVTGTGIHWIDFESVCRGPREWDLAFLPEGVGAAFDRTDQGLLSLARALVNAQVATWCWAAARFPAMRRHGELQLAALRSRTR